MVELSIEAVVVGIAQMASQTSSSKKVGFQAGVVQRLQPKRTQRERSKSLGYAESNRPMKKSVASPTLPPDQKQLGSQSGGQRCGCVALPPTGSHDAVKQR
jgi:hypothetical protein